jgi:hypothetical protein
MLPAAYFDHGIVGVSPRVGATSMRLTELVIVAPVSVDRINTAATRGKERVTSQVANKGMLVLLLLLSLPVCRDFPPFGV